MRCIHDSMTVADIPSTLTFIIEYFRILSNRGFDSDTPRNVCMCVVKLEA
jgi:hypothetical protein